MQNNNGNGNGRSAESRALRITIIGAIATTVLACLGWIVTDWSNKSAEIEKIKQSTNFIWQTLNRIENKVDAIDERTRYLHEPGEDTDRRTLEEWEAYKRKRRKQEGRQNQDPQMDLFEEINPQMWRP